MGTTQIMRRFEFEAAHRLLGHAGKCQYLHGHSYIAEVTIQAEKFDHLGMVVDFAIIKEKIGGWIDEMWDHNTLLHRMDPLLRIPVSVDQPSLFFGKTPYIMPDCGNPTAENMAKWLFRISKSLFSSQSSLKIAHVRIWETAKCHANYTEE